MNPYDEYLSPEAIHNPFIRYRQRIFAGSLDGDILRRLIVSLDDTDNYLLAAHRLRQLNAYDFAVAVKILVWVQLFGDEDGSFAATVCSIHESGLLSDWEPHQ